jgi:hypothetical protein
MTHPVMLTGGAGAKILGSTGRAAAHATLPFARAVASVDVR